MRVTLAIEKFIPEVGGAERYCWDLSHHLASRGHDIAVICQKATIPGSSRISIHTLLPIKFPQFLRHLSFSILHSLAVKRLKYDLNLCFGNAFFMDAYQPHGGVHKAWAERELVRYPQRIRKIAGLYRRSLLKNTVQRWMEQRIYMKTKPEVIAISEMIRNDIVHFYGYPFEKIHLIPNGIDTAKFTRKNRAYRPEVRSLYGLAEDDFVFVFVSNNLRLKGFDLLVDVCRMLKWLPFKLLVVGDTSIRVRSALKRSGLRDTIILAGKSESMEKIYPACDCLVHPTFYDACSLVVLEALASGIPVITTDANGAKMYVNENNGCIVPAGDTRALAGAMEGVVNAPRNKIQDVSFKDHIDTFTELEELFLEIIRKKRL